MENKVVLSVGIAVVGMVLCMLPYDVTSAIGAIVFIVGAVMFIVAIKKKKAAKAAEDMANGVQVEEPVYASRQQEPMYAAADPTPTKREIVRQRIEENKRNGVACCPRCGSASISANQKGYGIGKGVIGAGIAGPIGLVAGNAGRHKVIITCLNCGHQWKP